MDLGVLIALRPFAYHTTSGSNLAALRRARAVESTRRLFQRAGRAGDPLLRKRRTESLRLEIGQENVVIRDQRPLAAGAIEFEPGWDLARFVEHLNGFVFFWPGTAQGPIKYGRNHFQRYQAEGEDLAVVRVPTGALVEATGPHAPLLTRCNSGSARMNAGRRVPRGSNTFLAAPRFVGTAGDVKELVFEDTAALPDGTEWCPNLDGPWSPLG